MSTQLFKYIETLSNSFIVKVNTVGSTNKTKLSLTFAKGNPIHPKKSKIRSKINFSYASSVLAFFQASNKNIYIDIQFYI